MQVEVKPDEARALEAVSAFLAGDGPAEIIDSLVRLHTRITAAEAAEAEVAEAAEACEAIHQRAEVTRLLAEALNIPLVDGLELGSEKALAVVFSIVHGIVGEYLDGGDQLTEACSCGAHTGPAAYSKRVEPRREADTVREALAEDLTVTPAEYGRLVAEADTADEAKEWAAEVPSDEAGGISARIGTRVRLIRPVERYPHFLAEAGLEGTVTHIDEHVISVRMDETLVGAEAWRNEVHWYPSNGDNWTLDVEPA